MVTLAEMEENNMLTKNQFVKKLAKKTGTSVAVSKEIVNSFLETIQEAVYEDGGVSFLGLFKIAPEDVPERKGTIQIGEKKGQKYTIPAHKEVKATVSKGFRKSYEEVEVKFE